MSKENCTYCENTIDPYLNTTKVTIRLCKIVDIAEFVYLASKCQDDVVIKSGNFAINAKSLMGLYSSDLTKPLNVEFYGNIPYEVKDGIKRFLVSEV